MAYVATAHTRGPCDGTDGRWSSVQLGLLQGKSWLPKTHIVMAYSYGPYSYGLYSYGLCSWDYCEVNHGLPSLGTSSIDLPYRGRVPGDARWL